MTAYKHPIEKCLLANGIKIKALGDELGVSSNLLHYYFAKNAMPDEVYVRALDILERKGDKLIKFVEAKRTTKI